MYSHVSLYLHWFEAVVTELSFELVVNDVNEMLVRDDNITRFVLLFRSETRCS